MNFCSLEFLTIFLPIAVFGYFWLNKKKFLNLATAWLIVVSSAFYAFYKIENLPLIIVSLIINYAVGTTLCIDNKLKANKKTLYIVTIVLNVLFLAYFKILNPIFAPMLDSGITYSTIVMPLAYSFITFRQIIFLTDCYKEKITNTDFLSYALYITFFPTIVAGPLTTYNQIIPQFKRLRNKILNQKNLTIGLFLIGAGLFKKVVVADYLSPFATQVFDIVNQPAILETWFAMFAYTFQFYFDFSGYVDIAAGIAYLFNVTLPKNFDAPLRAISVRDFWHKWNITLSNFVKDYVYIPMGGSHINTWITYRNLVLTFLISGIMHGVNLTFIVWGFVQGAAMCIHRYWKNSCNTMQMTLAWLITFLFTSFSFLIFRCSDLSRLGELLKSLFGFNGYAPMEFKGLSLQFENGNLSVNILLILLAVGLTFFAKSTDELAKTIRPTKVYLAAIFVLYLIALINLNQTAEFIYFKI